LYWNILWCENEFVTNSCVMCILIFVDQETTEFAHNCISHHFYNPLTQQQKFQAQLSRVLFLDISWHCNRQSLRTRTLLISPDISWHCNRQSLRTRTLLISPDIIYVRFANGYKFLGYSLCFPKIIFGIIALCTIINFFQHVRETCSLHLQCDWIRFRWLLKWLGGTNVLLT